MTARGEHQVMYNSGVSKSGTSTGDGTAEVKQSLEHTIHEEGTRMNGEYFFNPTTGGQELLPKTSSNTHVVATAAAVASAAAAAAATTAPSVPIMGNSVVDDLMQVYENMKQSSTPQVSSNTMNDGREESQPKHRSTSLPSVPHQVAGYIIPSPHNIPMSIRMDGHTDHAAPGEESDGQSNGQSTKRKRRGSQDTVTSCGGSVSTPRGASSGGGGGSVTKLKKKSKQDGRWSKRFTWPEDLHRDFVSAIFDVGLKQSSPSTILEYMPKHDQITTERIKSHLQKYRLHRAKSKKEFIASYEASIRNLQNRGGTLSVSNSMGGGEVAAHLAYASSNGQPDGEDGQHEAVNQHSAVVIPNLPAHPTKSADWEETSPSGNSPKNQLPPTVQSDSLMLPELTEAEKQSPIGISMVRIRSIQLFV
jgi:SHAQKYF class myb-like DNA-binding protein